MNGAKKLKMRKKKCDEKKDQEMLFGEKKERERETKG